MRKWGESYKEEGLTRKYYRPHPKQAEILQSAARYRIFLGGKGAGKTACSALCLAKAISENPKATFLLAAPTYKIMQQASLKTWQDFVEGTSLQGIYKAQKQEYHLPTGGVIYLRSLEKDTSCEGIHPHFILLDEGFQLPQRTFEIVRSRLTTEEAGLLVTSTLYSSQPWVKDLLAKAEVDPDYCVVKCPSSENPGFSKSEFIRQKKLLPAYRFAIDYLGEWAEPEGLVLENFTSCIVEGIDKLPQGSLWGGCDFSLGGADFNAILIGVLDHEDVLTIFWEHYVKHRDIADIGKNLKDFHSALYKRTGRTPIIFCDHNPGLIQALRNAPVENEDETHSLTLRKADKRPGSVEAGLNLINARIRTGRLKILRGPVKALITEAQSYHYGDKGKRIGADHSIDSLRYMVSGIFNINKT